MTTKTASAPPTPAKVAASRKPKSPAAPSKSLRSSVDDALKLYSTYTRSGFSRAELASALGISATAGPTAQRIFSIKEYGLIQEDGDKFKVSENCVAIKIAAAGSADFKRAAYKAVMNVSLFRELIKGFNSKLPPPASVAVRLEQQLKFHGQRAKELSLILDDSLKFAGIVDSSGNIILPRDDEAATPRGDGESEGNDPGAGGNKDDEDRQEPNKSGFLKTEVPLKDGRKAIVHFPVDLAADEAKKIGNVLAALVG
jgi:hypothetical protein